HGLQQHADQQRGDACSNRPPALAAAQDDGASQTCRHQSGHEGHAIHAKKRCPSGQYAVDMAVANVQPAEVSENRAARPFQPCPGCCPDRREAPDGATAVAGKPVGDGRGQRGKKRQNGGKEPNRSSRQPTGHLAIHVHADIEPVQARGEGAETEGKARACCGPDTGSTPDSACQYGHGSGLYCCQAPAWQRPRRKRHGVTHPDQGQQQQATHECVSTLSQSARRGSARTTVMTRPLRSTTSPRRGMWSSASASQPPTVSYSSVSRSLANASLKRSMSVE